MGGCGGGDPLPRHAPSREGPRPRGRLHRRPRPPPPPGGLVPRAHPPGAQLGGGRPSLGRREGRGPWRRGRPGRGGPWGPAEVRGWGAGGRGDRRSCGARGGRARAAAAAAAAAAARGRVGGEGALVEAGRREGLLRREPARDERGLQLQRGLKDLLARQPARRGEGRRAPLLPLRPGGAGRGPLACRPLLACCRASARSLPQRDPRPADLAPVESIIYIRLYIYYTLYIYYIIVLSWPFAPARGVRGDDAARPSPAAVRIV